MNSALAAACIAAATLAVAFTASLAAWILLRFAAGVAAAWVLAHVSAWALGRLAPLRRPALNGLVYGGVGFGIAIAGAAALGLMATGADSAEAREALALISLLLSLPASRAMAPEGGERRGEVARAGGNAASRTLPTIVCCGILGLGYIIPATYLPAMARELLGDGLSFGWAWPILLCATSALLAASAAYLVFNPLD